MSTPTDLTSRLSSTDYFAAQCNRARFENMGISFYRGEKKLIFDIAANSASKIDSNKTVSVISPEIEKSKLWFLQPFTVHEMGHAFIPIKY